MTQPQNNLCPQCGRQVQADLLGNACPECLLGLAVSPAEEVTRDHHSAIPDSSHVPPIEKLGPEFPGLEIQHLVGYGGMGAVYQARQINLDRIVALKILSPALSQDPAFAERFLREARTLAKLSHPNIVTVFDFGKAGPFYHLTMEFIDGVNLRDTISANLLAPSEALAIVPQICDALQYAHDQGVVHRDVKPENILIAKNGGIKIADFGLAKILQPQSGQFTLTGTRQVMGTRNYMAPEQIETPDSVDHRADLYALGVVFYELLTGELPLGRFALPSEKSAAVSNQLDDVVMRTLEKDPNRRYQQASQIKTACQSVGAGANTDQPNRQAQQPSPPKPAATTMLCQPVPITIENIYASLASGFGLLRAYDTHLELEYEIRDSVVSHRWSAAKVRIPLERILSLNLHQGLIYTYLDVQADEFDVVCEIPSSKQGSFRVNVKRKDRQKAAEMVNCIGGLLSHHVAQPTVPVPPVKHASVAWIRGRVHHSNGFIATLITFGIIAFAAILGMAAVSFLSYIGVKSNRTEAKTEAVSISSSDENSAPKATKNTSNDEAESDTDEAAAEADRSDP